jgi:hypothetical protein
MSSWIEAGLDDDEDWIELGECAERGLGDSDLWEAFAVALLYVVSHRASPLKSDERAAQYARSLVFYGRDLEATRIGATAIAFTDGREARLTDDERRRLEDIAAAPDLAPLPYKNLAWFLAEDAHSSGLPSTAGFWLDRGFSLAQSECSQGKNSSCHWMDQFDAARGVVDGGTTWQRRLQTAATACAESSDPRMGFGYVSLVEADGGWQQWNLDDSFSECVSRFSLAPSVVIEVEIVVAR